MEHVNFLNNNELQFILFGGKGGVGKTTSSAATAVYLAKKNPDKKILVFSTDPAHSLADSFDCQLSNKAAPIKGFDNLFAMEMNADELHKDFVDEHLNEIMELASRATYFNTKQLKGTYALSYPSSFDFMVLMQMVDFVGKGEFNLVIFDTAPTGHTLQLFELLDKINDQLETMKRGQQKRKYMMKRLAGAYYKDGADKFITQIKEKITKLRRRLESSKTQFVPVTIAEAMGVYETERLTAMLRKYEIPVKQIIVNGLNSSSECKLCASRKKDQEKYIEEIKQRFPYEVITMPLFSHEIRGVQRLLEFAHVLSGKPYIQEMPEEEGEVVEEAVEKAVEEEAGKGVGEGVGAEVVNKVVDGMVFESHILDLPDNKKLKFILFGGKGGVGKTTSAVATAIYFAKNNPDKKILIFSTDPAHSLSDSFGYKKKELVDYQIGGKVQPIEGVQNLFALEIDPKKAFIKFKKEFEEKVNKAFKPKKSSSDTLGLTAKAEATHPFDEETIADLTSVAPLGLEELMALTDTLIRFKEEYDIVVIDTAPTGHLIRLLNRPNIVLDWFKNTVKGIRNYKGLMETYEPLKVLLKTKKQIMDTQQTLMDEEKTEFIPVTIPEAMGVYETEDLLKGIKGLEIASKHVIVNRVIPANKCSFCSSKRAEQRKYIKDIKQKFPEFLITEMPLFSHEIRGLNDLIHFGAVMYGK